MTERLVPKSILGDSDDVVVALETARAEEERGQKVDAARWIQRAASAARKQGRPERAGELSRIAVRLTGGTSSSPPPPDKFEPLLGEAQVLSDADEDSADKTIVDEGLRAQVARLSGPPTSRSTEEEEPTHQEVPRPRLPTPRLPSSGTSASPAAARSRGISEAPLLERPTPVAPLGKKSASLHATVRVAVRKTLGGKWEVRPLDEGEVSLNGEEEALLVALRPGAKWS